MIQSRKRLKPIIAGLTILLTSGYMTPALADEDHPALLQKFVSTKTTGSPWFQRLAARHYQVYVAKLPVPFRAFRRYGNDVSFEGVEEYLPWINDPAPPEFLHISEILTRWQGIRQVERSAIRVRKNQDAFGSALYSGLSMWASGTGAGSLIVSQATFAAIGFGLGQHSANRTHEFAQEMDARNKKWLTKALAKYRANYELEYRQLLDDGTRDEALNEFARRISDDVSYINMSVIQDPHVKSLLEVYIKDGLLSLIKKGQVTAEVPAAGDPDADVSADASPVVDGLNVLSDVGNINTARKKQIDLIKKFKEKAKAEPENETENRDASDLVDQMIVRSKSYEEALIGLKAIDLNQIEPSEKEIIVAKIRLLENEKEVQDKAADTAVFTSRLSVIAARMGNPELAAGLSNVANFSSNVNKFLSAAMKQDALGILDAATSVIFGQGVDPAMQRHQQLMDAIGQISKSLDQMKQSLNRIEIGITNVLNNQVAIHRSVLDLRNQVEANQLQLIASLNGIENSVLNNLVYIKKLMDEKVNNCIAFKNGRADYEWKPSGWPENLGFDKTVQHFLRNSAKFETCFETLDNVFLTPMESGAFNMSLLYETANDDRKVYIDKFYLPTWKNLRKLGVNLSNSSFNTIVRLMRNPSATVQALSRKLRPDQTVEAGQSPLHIASCQVNQNSSIRMDASAASTIEWGAKDIISMLGKTLSPQIIEKYIGHLFDLYGYSSLRQLLVEREIYNADGISDPSGAYQRFLDQDPSRYEIKFDDPRGYLILCHARHVVEAAIVQQTMMYGDAVIPLIIDEWRKNENNARSNIAKLFEKNGFIARNTLLKMVRELSSKADGFRMATYQLAYDTTSDRVTSHKVFTSLFGDELEVKWRDNRISVSDQFLNNPNKVIFEKLPTGTLLKFVDSSGVLRQVEVAEGKIEISNGQIVGSKDFVIEVPLSTRRFAPEIIINSNEVTTPFIIPFFGWGAVFSDTTVEMPSPEELRIGRLQTSASLPRLLQMRAALWDEITAYAVLNNKNTKKQNQFLRASFLVSAFRGRDNPIPE